MIAGIYYLLYSTNHLYILPTSQRMSDHLDSFDAELDESQFPRIFALGCFDALLTMPITIMIMVTNIVVTVLLFNFYQGWTFIHSNWEPVIIPKSIWSTTKLGVFSVHWDEWINPFFALIYFTLFGLTPEARKGYRKLVCLVRRPFGATQGDGTKEGLPSTATSNISSRYVQFPHPANTFQSDFYSSTQAVVSA